MAIALSYVRIDFENGLKISFSSLLVCMMLGTIFCNTCEYSEDLMERAEKWTSPLNATFFVLSGAALDARVFADIRVVLVGVVYILARSAGKYFGAAGSSAIMQCSPTVKKYLGITLLPQAGVALGMVVSAQILGGQDSIIIKNIILFAVLIYELIGPLLTKISLEKAGEITAKASDAEHRKRFAK